MYPNWTVTKADMQTSSEEEKYLAVLDRHINQAEENILKLNNELKALDGEDSSVIKRLEFLKILLHGLILMQEHRAEIASSLREKKGS
ncbi:MAG: hypothetical protein EOO38_03730 [Cytophagaceae bacterium]|nr:MAG: hypothetical protein EOO38_03730 [Cytophagaceae bacterium]